jgi:serine-type D-Ala-D-Ala carboxypeptidase/endopeptidase (penicillin-binding protein 4)
MLTPKMFKTPKAAKNKYFIYANRCIFLILLFFIFSCSPTKKLQKTKVKEYQNLIQNSVIFDQGFTGFQLYDPASEKVLFSLNDDKYFTPASNTKIFTFYTALHVLGDSIPAFRYIVKGDSLIFWGTGDPSFNHPYLTQNERIIQFFKNRTEKLFFCTHNFQDDRFGSGWAWDDYYDSYQPEKSSFPLHGNIVHFEKEKPSDTFEIKPNYFENKLVENQKLNSKRIKRDFESNFFDYNPERLANLEYKKDHPFKYSDQLLATLLSDFLNKKVELLNLDSMPSADAKVVHSVLADTLYRRLMQESDNFIAEQLLLLCANALFDTLNVSKIIQFAKENLLSDLPDQANWVDGSGLSRYNMFTPRSIVCLLADLYKKIPQKRLFHIFPAGGESGTISTRYNGIDKPYVYAKTGTLRNKHCLSGYLITKSGKVLIFSFMHNNYPNGSAAHKDEMERVLKAIYLAY